METRGELRRMGQQMNDRDDVLTEILCVLSIVLGVVGAALSLLSIFLSL